MVLHFYYSAERAIDGILNYFLSLGEETLWNNIEYSATSANENHYPQNAFTTKDYWVGKTSQTGSVNLSFCLKNYYANIYGFELQTSDQQKKIKAFNFSASRDNSTYQNFEGYDLKFSSNEANFFSWRHGLFKCFKITVVKATTGDKTFDVKRVDLYGDFYSSKHEYYKDISCHSHDNFNFRFMQYECSLFMLLFMN